jgi:hypothetical protein
MPRQELLGVTAFARPRAAKDKGDRIMLGNGGCLVATEGAAWSFGYRADSDC